MKKTLAKVAVIASLIATSASANLAERMQSCLDGSLSEDAQADLILEMLKTDFIFDPFTRQSIEPCFENLTGRAVSFEKGRGLLGADGSNDFATIRREATIIRNNRLSREEEAQVERRRQQAEAEAENAEIEKRIEAITTELACISRAEKAEREALQALAEADVEANRALVAVETHQSCVALYNKDQDVAMRNQVCINVFDDLGHPNFQPEAAGAIAVGRERILDLNLRTMELNNELYDFKVERDPVLEKQSDRSKDKQSCAMFGFEGVYID